MPTLCIAKKELVLDATSIRVGIKPPHTTRYHVYAKSVPSFLDQVGRQLSTKFVMRSNKEGYR